MERLFLDLSAIVVVAAALGLIARLLKQPLILAYVVAGFLLGPQVLGFISDPDFVHTLSSFGIALVLFLVGLELDLERLRSLGRVSIILGLAQVVSTAAIGYVIVKAFGLASLPAAYIAIALTFASTIIVVKLLSEQQSLESLYGRLTVGILLVQDFIAMLALIVLSGFQANGSAIPTTGALALIILKGLGIMGFTYLASRYFLPTLFTTLAKSAEMLMLASLAWCFILALLAVGLGFSIEIGSFLAGLALASLPYHLEIIGRVRSLRDFFVTIFFVMLGSQLTLTAAAQTPVIVLSLFVLIGQPLIVMTIMGLWGYRKRTGFLVGLTMAQVSEFSLILMALGLKLGHVSAADVSLVTLVGIITITISSYLITYGEKLYRWCTPFLSVFERAQGTAEHGWSEPTTISGHVVLFGYHRLGEKIVATLEKLGQQVLIVDFNPSVIKHLAARGKLCLYGDMSDLEIQDKCGLARSTMIISTVPDSNDNLALLADVRRHKLNIPVYLTATTWHDTKELYAAGADYVIFPHYLSAEHFSTMLQALNRNPNRVRQDRDNHLRELELHYASRTSH
ncbi:MAG: cation:proton antiporter [Candidatus Kerfeldbacteria bacterium]|nr:cation:proton antiporter [Candidatus Kerfeldbacteria bacterium]